jgi:DUF971 family protein
MPVSRHEPLRPVALGKEGEERFVIDWSDGHRSIYTWKHLRDNCPCAGCRGEFGQPPDPFRILSEKELSGPKVIRPVEIAPVGRYAYKIVWNDGHDTGLYTLENLRALCQCPQCAKKS